MADGDSLVRPRIRAREYWSWVTVALFLLVTVDLLTSLYAAAEYGVGSESNPLMAWLLVQPLLTLVAINVGVTVLASSFFWALLRLLERTPPRLTGAFGLVVEAYLGALVAAGLLVFANNLAVIVHGESLL